MGFISMIPTFLEILYKTLGLVIVGTISLLLSGFVIYYLGRMLGAGIAKSWYQVNENIKEKKGDLNNGNEQS